MKALLFVLLLSACASKKAVDFVAPVAPVDGDFIMGCVLGASLSVEQLQLLTSTQISYSEYKLEAVCMDLYIELSKSRIDRTMPKELPKLDRFTGL